MPLPHSRRMLNSFRSTSERLQQRSERRARPASNQDAAHLDGLVQDCSISIALAMEILQSCAEPSICRLNYNVCNLWNGRTDESTFFPSERWGTQIAEKVCIVFCKTVVPSLHWQHILATTWYQFLFEQNMFIEHTGKFVNKLDLTTLSCVIWRSVSSSLDLFYKRHFRYNEMGWKFHFHPNSNELVATIFVYHTTTVLSWHV